MLPKLVRKEKFSERKFEEIALALKSKKVQGIFRETFILALLSSAFINLQNHVSDFLLICFSQEIKGFYQSSLGNEFDFRDIMNASPNILAKH